MSYNSRLYEALTQLLWLTGSLERIDLFRRNPWLDLIFSILLKSEGMQPIILPSSNETNVSPQIFERI